MSEFDEFSEQEQHTSYARFDDADDNSRFVLKPIPQMLLELVMSENAKSIFYLVIGLVHLLGYVQESFEANLNLQRLIRYRSQFHFLPNVGFLHEDHLEEKPHRSINKWCIVNGSVWVNQLANLCFVIGMDGLHDATMWKLYLLGTGVALWTLVHLLWNWTYVLFGKPNFYHGYQAKQWFLMNSKFWLAGCSMYLVLNGLQTFAMKRHYGYHGPMHIVDFHTQVASTPLSDYLFLTLKGGSQRTVQQVMQDLKTLKKFSNMEQVEIQEYKVMLDLSWGGKWGCPKQPEKHCRATAEFKTSSLIYSDWERAVVKYIRAKTPFKAPNSAPMNVLSLLFGAYSWAPCNRPVCPIDSQTVVNETTGAKRWSFRQMDCQACPVNEYQLTGLPFDSRNITSTAEETSSLSHPDGIQYTAELCAASVFHKSFDNVTRAYKKSPLHRHRKPRPKVDNVWNMMGDCNTCSVTPIPPTLGTRAVVSTVCFFLGMIFLAGWAVLAFFTYLWGWNQPPPEDWHLELYPTGPPTMWQFVGFYYTFFA